MNKFIYYAIIAVATLATAASCSQKASKLVPTDKPTDSICIDTLVYLGTDRNTKLNFHINYQLFSDSTLAATNNAIIATDSTLADYQDSLSMLSPRKAIETFARKYCNDYVHDANLIRAQERDSTQLLNWEFALDSKLMRGRNGNIVVLQHLRVYEGGRNAVEYTLSRNIQQETLKPLTVSDLLSEGETQSLTADFVRQIIGMYRCNDLDELRKKGFFIDTEPYLSNNFYITDGAVTFIYAPGEIAPSAEGEIIVTIEL